MGKTCRTLIRCKMPYWLSLIVMFVATFLFGHIFFMSYFPFKAIEVKEPIPVVQKNVYRGEVLTYICIYKKYVDKDAILQMQLHNLDVGHYISLPEEHSNVLVGQGTALKTVLIPRTVVVGRYKMVLTVKYDYGYFRTIVKKFMTEEFNVLSR